MAVPRSPGRDAETGTYPAPSAITLLQERYAGDLWVVLVASLCLKRRTRAQAEDVVGELLDRYPTPESLLAAERGEVEALLRALGLRRTRADELVQIADRLSDEGLSRRGLRRWSDAAPASTWSKLRGFRVL